MTYRLVMSDIIENSLEQIKALEGEEAWVKDQLHDVPFCEYTLKSLLKQHLKDLEEKKLKVMHDTITNLYKTKGD